MTAVTAQKHLTVAADLFHKSLKLLADIVVFPGDFTKGYWIGKALRPVAFIDIQSYP